MYPKIISSYMSVWVNICIWSNDKTYFSINCKTEGIMNNILLKFPILLNKIDCATKHLNKFAMKYLLIHNTINIYWLNSVF